MLDSIVFLVRVWCHRYESSRSLSHLLMSFLLLDSERDGRSCRHVWRMHCAVCSSEDSCLCFYGCKLRWVPDFKNSILTTSNKQNLVWKMFRWWTDITKLYLEPWRYTVWVKKVAPLPENFLRYFLSWWTYVIENYLGYCPNIFLCLHQFWSIYLNIYVKYIIFTGVTPQILRIQFSLLRNSWIFRKNTSHIKWHLIKYNN